MNGRTLVLKRFKEIGLTSYEAKSYLSLLQRDTLTVAEVSKIAGIPRANAYEALEKLMTKGMCIAKPGQTKRYSASDPALLEDRFLGQLDQATKIEIQSLKADMEAKEKQILQDAEVAKRNIGEMMKELKPQFEESRLETNPLNYIEIIRDPYQIHRKFVQLVSEAKEEVLMFTKPPYSGPREKLEEQVDQQTQVSRRGIRFRCIYEIAKDEKERKWQRETINRATAVGQEARVIEELPVKLAIFDSRIVIYVLEDPVSRRISLTTQTVEHRALAKALKLLFETVWAQAQDYHISKD
jgi:sugar-specific transcriptional regulator TrmB